MDGTDSGSCPIESVSGVETAGSTTSDLVS
jgi:hypothetical protein